jgi:hypothetical protein
VVKAIEQPSSWEGGSSKHRSACEKKRMKRTGEKCGNDIKTRLFGKATYQSMA